MAEPVQKPHPPIVVGGGFPHAAKRAIAYGDGWMPIGGRADPLEVLPQFRKLAQDAGRDPASLSVSIFGAPRNLDVLKRYRDAGINRVVLGLPSKSRDEVLPILDHAQSEELDLLCQGCIAAVNYYAVNQVAVRTGDFERSRL